jgi:DNA-binding NarL/FixJ family response regulator
MSQWGVQLVIGKLVTDEEFRRGFTERGGDYLAALCERGVDLNEAEIAALVEADPRLWSRMATRIDHRLRKIGGTAEWDDQRARPRTITRREQQVLRGIFEGLTNKEIGTHVGVSESAVKATLQQLFRKARVRTRAQLVRIAVEGSLGSTRRPR